MQDIEYIGSFDATRFIPVSEFVGLAASRRRKIQTSAISRGLLFSVAPLAQ